MVVEYYYEIADACQKSCLFDDVLILLNKIPRYLKKKKPLKPKFQGNVESFHVSFDKAYL